MLRIKRRIIAYILVFIMTASSCFGMYSLDVEASGILATFTGVLTTVRWAAALMGYTWSDDIIHSMSESDDFRNALEELIAQNEIAENSDGTITFSEEAIQQLRSLFDEYLAEHPEDLDVVWLPVITEKDLKSSWFNSIDDYNNVIDLFEDHDLVGLKRNEKVSSYLLTSYYFDMSDLSIYKGSAFDEAFIQDVSTLADVFGRSPYPNLNFRSYFVSRTGVKKTPDWYYHTASGKWLLATGNAYLYDPAGLYNPFYYGEFPVPTGQYSYFIPVASSKSSISFLPVFTTQSAYMDWITGSGSYYRFDSGYTGGDITINPDADYSEILDAITEVIRQSIENGEEMSKILSDMQDAFDKALKDLSGALDDIGDNTEKTNTWLEKIYELLEDQQEQLKKYFDSAGGSFEDLLELLGHVDEDGHNTNLFLAALLSFLQNQEQELQDYFDSAGGNFDDLLELLGHVDEDGHTTNSLLSDLLGMLQEQREELGEYMAAAKEYMESYPDQLHEWLVELKEDIVDGIQDIVKAVKGIDLGDHVDSGGDSLWTKLGEGLAKIFTAMLNLLKIMIFKGLDALVYLISAAGDRIDGVFEEISGYIDSLILELEDGTALYQALFEAVPEEIQKIMVLFVFALVACSVFSYVRR